MLRTVAFGGIQHISLLHLLGMAHLLRRHVLCPVCLKLHLPHLLPYFYSSLFYSILFWGSGGGREVGKGWCCQSYYILIYSTICYAILLYSSLRYCILEMGSRGVFSVLLLSNIFYYILLYFTVLYCTVLYFRGGVHLLQLAAPSNTSCRSSPCPKQ